MPVSFWLARDPDPANESTLAFDGVFLPLAAQTTTLFSGNIEFLDLANASTPSY